MKNNKTVLLIALIILIASFSILNDDDLRELYELHYANKLIVNNESAESDYVIEDKELSEYIHHVYYKKKKFPDDIDNWEKVVDIAFYNDDEMIMEGTIIRLNVSSSDQELYSGQLEHMKSVDDYYYLYTVEVRDLFLKKIYCSTIEEDLIFRLLKQD
ncbi:MAG: hypothetical protein U9Q80_08470 [Bacillota bacterium]|nr:hypothetical protein [Bacillota bacterium]